MIKFWPIMAYLLFALLSITRVTADDSPGSDKACELIESDGPRFIKLANSGLPLTNQDLSSSAQPWSCVHDRHTHLVWEVKSGQPGLHFSGNRLTWFNPNTQNNGGFAGYPNQGLCTGSDCDTDAFLKAINSTNYCGSSQWRLPDREELRSLVDYAIPFPGPTISQNYFPHTLAQYYWSATPDSDDKDSVWGIGFSFGFDYAYFKSHAGYVRAVYEARP